MIRNSVVLTIMFATLVLSPLGRAQDQQAAAVCIYAGRKMVQGRVLESKTVQITPADPTIAQGFNHGD
jgi:hypothetical protein